MFREDPLNSPAYKLAHLNLNERVFDISPRLERVGDHSDIYRGKVRKNDGTVFEVAIKRRPGRLLKGVDGSSVGQRKIEDPSKID